MAAEERDRPLRGQIVDAKDVAELDFGIEVMAVVVFGEDESNGVERGDEPGRALPADFARVTPPQLQLSEREAGERAADRERTARSRDREVGERTEKAVEQDRRIARDDGMIPIRAPAVVVGAKVQLAPDVLWDVIQERRREIAGDEDHERRDRAGDEGRLEHG